MWLVNTTTLQLEEFYPSQAPPYAILSHTWDHEEVTFRDMSSPSASSKKGYAKIVETCRLAKLDHLDYAWIDTCCIDKSSSAELTESINSMFKWYRNGKVCYAFLADLLPGLPDSLGSCRWFTRGWTLQELLAPRRLEFLDMKWEHIGSRYDFADTISARTGIPCTALSGEVPLSDFSVAARMSWAANRQTTREEDESYCLLGIFDIAMPLLYGEGGCGAFRRLQEEIIKRISDMTIFAWDLPTRGTDQDDLQSTLAPSPDAF